MGLLIINLLLKLADIGITLLVFNKYGQTAEANPLTQTMFHSLGEWWTFVLIFALHSMICLLLYKFKKRNMLIVVAAIVFIIGVVNNLFWLIHGPILI